VQFFAEALQCEYEMTHATYRMQKDLSEQFTKRPVNTAALFATMQVRTLPRNTPVVQSDATELN